MKYTALDGFMGDMNQPIQIEDKVTSIRKIILSIPSHEDPQRFPSLFHAFEYLKDGPVVIFQTSINNEASYMVEHLVEYLRWKFGKHLVKQFFDIEVIREKNIINGTLMYGGWYHRKTKSLRQLQTTTTLYPTKCLTLAKWKMAKKKYDIQWCNFCMV